MVNKSAYSDLELMQARIKMIPNGWVFSYVGKVFSIKNNLRRPISEEIRAKNVGRYPYFGPTKIQGYIDTYEQDGHYVLIGEDGDHFLKYESQSMTQLVDGKCTVNNHAHIIEGTNEATREWFYYYFMHRDIFSFLSRQGAGRYKLNKASLEKIPLIVPPLGEQKKIAKIISTWDKAIFITEKLLANSQQQKKAMMQQLVTGKKRFPEFEGKWKKIKLSAVADMNSGGTPSSSIDEYYNGGIPWVSIADMTSRGKWISSTDKTLSQKGLENSSARLYPENTVLYAMYASIGECSIARVPLCSSQAILGIRPKKELHYEYLYFFLCSMKEQIKLQGQQGTQSNLNAGMVKDFIINLPSIEEQKIISSVLNLSDQEIDVLKQKLYRLKQEKKALMQQLLTGKRRVKTEAA